MNGFMIVVSDLLSTTNCSSTRRGDSCPETPLTKSVRIN